MVSNGARWKITSKTRMNSGFAQAVAAWEAQVMAIIRHPRSHTFYMVCALPATGRRQSRRRMGFKPFPERVVHPSWPAFTRRLECLDHFGVVADRRLHFGRRLLRGAMAQRCLQRGGQLIESQRLLDSLVRPFRLVSVPRFSALAHSDSPSFHRDQ